MKSLHLPALRLTFVLATLPLAAGCRRSEAEVPHDPKPEAAAPIAVKQAEAQALKVPRTLVLSGSLIGSQEAKVAAGAAGKVVATYVERGSVVRKGAVLVKLDARALGAQAQEAAAQAESAKAQEAQAKLDCARTEQMLAKGAISKADYDKAHTACESTKWSVSAAEARKTLTAEALHDTEIKAPFSGMVIERFVTAGEYVRVDSPVVSLVDVDALRVELTVPEADVVSIKQGMVVDFHPAANDDGRVYRGKIRYIGPSVRAQTRDAVVEASIENPGHDLRPGMFVTAKVALGEQTLPAVPASAVRAEGTLRHVFTVTEGRLEDHLVQVDDARAGLVPVVSGIKAGDRVVVDVTAEMRDGAKVQ
ncbi:MAG TPA: efflux RND transporter periplasmic adaptor subunit [Polyangia bacterium]|nr:efflux RND transporter periplasmic adaptor subunit [Polyangia bacterium]